MKKPRYAIQLDNSRFLIEVDYFGYRTQLRPKPFTSMQAAEDRRQELIKNLIALIRYNDRMIDQNYLLGMTSLQEAADLRQQRDPTRLPGLEILKIDLEIAAKEHAAHSFHVDIQALQRRNLELQRILDLNPKIVAVERGEVRPLSEVDMFNILRLQ